MSLYNPKRYWALPGPQKNSIFSVRAAINMHQLTFCWDTNLVCAQQGYAIKSACIHQWAKYYSELQTCNFGRDPHLYLRFAQNKFCYRITHFFLVYKKKKLKSKEIFELIKNNKKPSFPALLQEITECEFCAHFGGYHQYNRFKSHMNNAW